MEIISRYINDYVSINAWISVVKKGGMADTYILEYLNDKPDYDANLLPHNAIIRPHRKSPYFIPDEGDGEQWQTFVS